MLLLQISNYLNSIWFLINMFKKIRIPYEINDGENALGNNKYFDKKMGAIGSLIMGSVVFHINSKYGIDTASIVATKQAAYSFVIGGSMVKFCENTSIYFQNPKVSKIMSSLIPATLTIGLTYLVHSLKGTPEPLESTIPTLILTPFSFAVLGNNNRNQLEKLLVQYKLKENI